MDVTDDRLHSDANLDAVLGGGLLRNAITLIAGDPGTGKTILAQRYAFASATPERPSVYFSTVSEPLAKLLRYGQRLSFFDVDQVGVSVQYEDLGGLLRDDGLTGALERVNIVLKERGPALVVIDSFKALRAFARDDGEFRRFLHDLSSQMSALAVTALWIGEYSAEEMTSAPEFAVADTILLMTSRRVGERDYRFMDVRKFRGSEFLSGQHAYRVTSHGIKVFPRLADPTDTGFDRLDGDRISSGIPRVDAMLDAGLWRGASTLVVGPAGSGKTLMGLHFILRGAELGESGVIATLQENPSQLERTARGFGWSLDREDIQLMYRSPVDLYTDEWVHEVFSLVERTRARRLVIDSLDDLRRASGESHRFREFLYSLVQRLARADVSILMTMETLDLYGIARLSTEGISNLSDNVVLLQYLRGESQIKRAITVLKSRASGHDPEIRQFDITSEGFAPGDAFTAEQDLG